MCRDEREPYVPPATSIFDEDGNVIEYGEKFYTPFEELAIMPLGSDRWISGKEFLEQAGDVDGGSELSPR